MTDNVYAVGSYGVLGSGELVRASRSYAILAPLSSQLSGKSYVILRSFIIPYHDLRLDYDFIDVRFPEKLSYGSSGGPGFKTSVSAVDSGMISSKPEWDRLRANYEVSFDYATISDIEEIEQFFYGMRGRAIGFRFKDWSDYQITHQNLAVGNGFTREYQIFKRYRSGAHFFDRMIKKPVRNSIEQLFLDDIELVEGTDFFVGHTTGILRFVTAPPSGSIARVTYMEFDVPVRFDSDEINIEAVDFNQYRVSGLPLIEVLV